MPPLELRAMNFDAAYKLVTTSAAGRTICRWFRLDQADEAVAAFNRRRDAGLDAMLAAYNPGQGFLPQFCTQGY